MKLKRKVENALWLITGILFIGALMVDYLSIDAIGWYLLIWCVIGFNAFILKRYGKGVLNEAEK